MDERRIKWNEIQKFLEYQPDKESTTFQEKFYFPQSKRTRIADIDRFSETSSVCGSSSSGDTNRPRRTHFAPMRFTTTDYKNTRSREARSSSSMSSSSKRYDPNERFTVEEIRDINLLNGEICFLVKWENYSEKHNTWEPYRNVIGCSDCVSDYVEQELSEQDEDVEKVMQQYLNEHKDDIEKYGKKYNKGDVLKELNENEIDRVEYRCYQLVYMLIKNGKPEYYPAFRKRFLKNVILKYFRELLSVQEEAHAAIKNEIMEKEMNAFSISIENNVDFQLFEKFNYVRENIMPKNLNNLSSERKNGCDCINGCSAESNCCPSKENGAFAYKMCGNMNDKRLRLRYIQMIYECNEFCKCKNTCLNRVTQQPRSFSLAIFKTRNGRGWGLKTLSAIPRGTYLFEYTGEIIDQAESIRRGEKYDEIGKSYLFDLDFNENSEAVYTIDAARYGNLARLLNHCCEPNCRILPVTNCNQDSSLYKLCYFTTKLIKAGEELTSDYSGGDEFENMSENGDDDGEKEDIEARGNGAMNNNSIRKHHTLDVCKCGSSICKGRIFPKIQTNSFDLIQTI